MPNQIQNTTYIHLVPLLHLVIADCIELLHQGVRLALVGLQNHGALLLQGLGMALGLKLGLGLIWQGGLECEAFAGIRAWLNYMTSPQRYSPL